MVSGAMIMCSFGVAPSSLMVLPTGRVVGGAMPHASIMDYAPMVNILPFGMCITPSNPTVASATAAALGVLTPMPCIPVIPAPWVPGSPTSMVGTFPALHSACTCMCAWGGVISILYPGQVTTQVT